MLLVYNNRFLHLHYMSMLKMLLLILVFQLNHLLKNGAVAGGFIMAALLSDRFAKTDHDEHTL